MLQIVINAALVSAVGVILTAMTQGLRREIGELRRELKGDIAGFRTELKGDNASLRTELKGDIAELRVELREMRSDLTLVALAVGAKPRARNS